MLASLLGGYPALLSMAALLVVQCLLFADGGLLALGANTFNMAVIPCLVVYPLLFRPIVRGGLSHRRVTVAALVSALVALEMGALCVTLQTLASGVTELPFATFGALMLAVHLAIGAAEGLATAALLNFVLKVRPELLAAAITEGDATAALHPSLGKLTLVGAVLALLVAGGLSRTASGDPDGLEWSIERAAEGVELEDTGEVHSASDAAQDKSAPLADYQLPSGGGTGAAGIIGSAITCALVFAVGTLLSALRKRHHQSPERH